MTKTVFIAAAEPYSGKSLVSLGLINMLLRKTPKVGYFKPIINFEPAEKKDAHIETIIGHFGLPITYDGAYAYTRADAMHLVETDTQGEIIDTIIHKFKALEEHYDFIVVEGSDFLGAGTAFEFDANISIAKNLGAPAILMISGEAKTTNQIVNAALTMLRSFEGREVPVLAIIVNKMPPSEADTVRELLGGNCRRVSS
ncbi:AAA family ATPase [Hymenobacter qilianensis]|uniref:AAA family ATPase n=1 Tax=Hymenobacter qilianensis TaxID=1385715 RepID=UPI001CB8CB72|nr:AAA family ATPase [Hymenobacter qilianensis]